MSIDIRDKLRNQMPIFFSKGLILDACRGLKLDTEYITKIYG